MTYKDVLEHVLDYIGADTTAQTERFARRAVQNAVSEFWSQRMWAIFYRRGRIITNPSYSTGTITYLYSGGAYPRQVTLSGGTWPSWAGCGTLQLGQYTYPISSRISNTVVQLQTNLAANQNLANATPYMLVQESYPLPVDFSVCDEIVNVGRGGIMYYQTPGDFIRQQRIHMGPALPMSYTIQGDSRRYGTLVVSFYPAPDLFYTMDYSYRRQSRALSSHGAVPVVAYTDGTASVAAGSAVVTGSGTLWTADMVGAMIRFSGTPNSKVPTGQSGVYPFYLQRTIVSWTSATQITMDAVSPSDLSGVPYSISDPVDLEAGAMSTYFLRECEKQMRILRRMVPIQGEDQNYAIALRQAQEADARHNERRNTFGDHTGSVRIASMPAGNTIGG